MAGEVFDLKVQGLDELKRKLQAMPDKLRARPIRNALAAGARIVRDAAKAHAPVLREPDPHRTPGTVRNAIKLRTSKQSKAAGDIGVFINVKPLTAKQIRAYKAESGRGGAKNPNDPFYWRFLEFGRKARAGEGARERRLRNKVLGIKGLRRRRALRAVGALPAYRFLQRAAERLPDALKAFEQNLGPQVQKLNDKLQGDL